MNQAMIYWRTPRLYFAAFMFFVTLSSSALADGKFFFPSVGAEKDPGIPFQRAIIAYRDGVENLIIESAVDAPGGDFGWVIPLPAEPTSIAQCKAGTLKATYQLVCPRIEAQTEGGLATAGSLVLLCSLLACLIIARSRHKDEAPLSVLTKIVLVFLVCFLFNSVLLNSMGRAGIAVAPGVAVLQHQQVGNYDVKVITGESSDSILEWALENGFRVPQEAKPVLDEYIQAKWCFAAAQIHSDDKGLLAPHPLKFTFQTPKAVYPMKLTGVGAIDMQLDLYIIGEKRSLVPPLDLISCDTYRPSHNYRLGMLDDDVKKKFNVEFGKQYKAEDVGIIMGHPELTSLMWSGCTVTHLRKKLRPDQMQTDYEIDWASSHPTRKKLYTPGALRNHSRAIAYLFASAVLLPATIVVSMRTGTQFRTYRWMLKAIGAGFIVGALAGVITYAWLPRATPVPENRREAVQAWLMSHNLPWIYADILTELSRSESAIDAERFADWWRQQLSSNEYLDQQPQQGDLPGGYEISKKGADLVLTIYDEYATPIRFTVISENEQ